MRITITPDNLKEYPFHKHETSEIVCYFQGEGIMETEQGNVPFQKGTLLILPPNITHRSKSENGFKNICVHLRWN
ncbi:MAG: AraC family ligand binding domain-containing protein [Candidatus Scatosoma sp.]